MAKKLILVGSNSSKSINLAVARQLQKRGEFELVFLRDFEPIPMFSEDLERNGIPEPIKKIEAIVAAHDTIVLFTPEHNGYYPSFLKNVFDWMSRSPSYPDHMWLKNKKMVIACVSPGPTGGETVRKLGAELLRFSGVTVIGTVGVGLMSGPAAAEDGVNKIVALLGE